MKKTVLGIIPARGGSKGVPRKNIRPLAGRPLISHTIETALQARSLDRIIVSTDDREIAEVARQAGAETPFLRPQEHATDTASSISVVHHALAWLSQHEGYHPDAVAIMPPTSPLRTVQQVDATVDLLWTSGLDSALTVTPVRDHPYFIYSCENNGRMKELIEMKNKPLRRQELPTYYTHSQSVIVSRSSFFHSSTGQAPLFNFSSAAGLEIDRESALDIDTPADFEFIEKILERRLTDALEVANLG